MPVPALITDLNIVAASNSPAGTDPIGNNLDDYLRASFAFIAQLRDSAGSLSGAPVSGTNGLVLTGTQAAGRCVYVTAGATITLPIASSVPVGTCIYFRTSTSGANRIIQPQGADTLTNRVTTGNIVLQDGDDALVQSGTGGWTAFGGIQNLGASMQFAASLAANGYQKLPSGLILQWGTLTSSASADVTITYPIAFPTAVKSLVATAYASGAGYFATPNALAVSTCSVSAWSSASTRVSAPIFWSAIGY
ncbi:gp53-like domain-containing protein [Chitinibacter bivalviorum]|uniref:gp53-like domain-containing protein n=1 Tax=Chitinibacter bivalviorum TaxID=2739434 RepID=UPI003F68E1D7